MEHRGHQGWKLDLGSPWWCLGHYYPARACFWAFKCIKALCIDLTGCFVLTDLSNYLSFVQLTWWRGSTFLASGAPGSSWGIWGLGLVLRQGSWSLPILNKYVVGSLQGANSCGLDSPPPVFLDLKLWSGNSTIHQVRLCFKYKSKSEKGLIHYGDTGSVGHAKNPHMGGGVSGSQAGDPKLHKCPC